MHRNDNWHKVCTILSIDPWRFDAISINKDGRVHVLEPKWQQLTETSGERVANSQESSGTAARRSTRRKPKVKPIYWDYKFVREIAETEEDPVAFLTGTTGCSAGAAKQAIKRAMGAQW